MNELKVKIKKENPRATIPSYAKQGDAGMDITAINMWYDTDTDTIHYETGLSFEVPEGYYIQLSCRSSVYKMRLSLTNNIGIVDSGYRGAVKFVFRPALPSFYGADVFSSNFQNLLERGIFKYFETREDSEKGNYMNCDIYKIGDRIGQLIILPYPQIQFEEAEQLSETERGTGGYGHTGN